MSSASAVVMDSRRLNINNTEEKNQLHYSTTSQAVMPFKTRSYIVFRPSLFKFLGANNTSLCATNTTKLVILHFLLSLSFILPLSIIIMAAKMLWVDKHRPTSLDQMDYHKPLSNQLKKMVQIPFLRNWLHLEY